MRNSNNKPRCEKLSLSKHISQRGALLIKGDCCQPGSRKKGRKPESCQTGSVGVAGDTCHRLRGVQMLMRVTGPPAVPVFDKTRTRFMNLRLQEVCSSRTAGRYIIDKGALMARSSTPVINNGYLKQLELNLL